MRRCLDSPDATLTFNRYSFSYGNTQFPDYPKLGVWPDGYYISFNIFNNGITFAARRRVPTMARRCAAARRHASLFPIKFIVRRTIAV